MGGAYPIDFFRGGAGHALGRIYDVIPFFRKSARVGVTV